MAVEWGTERGAAAGVQVLTSVAQTGFKLVENMELADAEWHVFTYDGHPVFVPGAYG